MSVRERLARAFLRLGTDDRFLKRLHAAPGYYFRPDDASDSIQRHVECCARQIRNARETADGLTVYRAVVVDNDFTAADIRRTGAGIHWTFDAEAAQPYGVAEDDRLRSV